MDYSEKREMRCRRDTEEIGINTQIARGLSNPNFEKNSPQHKN
jgi:hypothetical protein